MVAKTAAPPIAVKGLSWELLEELLNAADQGGGSTGGVWGRRRREGGDGSFWDMCVKVKVVSD